MSQNKIATKPWCPFCGINVGKPSDAVERKMQEFPVGKCQCGAVYVCDATGLNVGAAMVEALVCACDDNWDFAWELMPEDDYLTGRLEGYDEQRHEIIDTGNVDGRFVRGVLYFVRLHTETSEISKRVKKRKDSQVDAMNEKATWETPTVEKVPDEKRKRKKANKVMVKALVEDADIDELVSLCFDDKKTLRLMQRLLYNPYDNERWHVSWVIGQVCARVATLEPGQVSDLIHRLFGACSDSAATPWGMIETIGEIISNRPDIFGAFTRHLLDFAAEESTRVQVMWSLGEIAKKRPDLILMTPYYSLFNFLNHPDPTMRGQVARILGRINAKEVELQLMGLNNDQEKLTVREQGVGVEYTVAELAQQALNDIRKGKKND